MNKEELRRKVNPLNSREKIYINHTEQRNPFSDFADKEEFKGRDGILTLNFNPANDLYDRDKRHGLFYDDEIIRPEIQNLPIIINKQSRFSEVPIHIRNYIEMKYVYEGSATAILEGKKISLARGDVILLDYGSVHTVLPLGKTDIVFNVIMRPELFNESFLNLLKDAGTIGSFLAETINKDTAHDRHFLVRTHDDALLRESMENAVCTYLDPSFSAKTVIFNYLQLFFIRLAECYQKEKEEEYQSAGKSYITEIITWLDENVLTATLEEAAAHFGYSPDHFSRLIKKTTGTSFKEYILAKRMETVTYQLVYSTASIEEIAARNGFTNLYFFYKKFKKEKGCTPQEYRSRKKELK